MFFSLIPGAKHPFVHHQHPAAATMPRPPLCFQKYSNKQQTRFFPGVVTELATWWAHQGQQSSLLQCTANHEHNRFSNLAEEEAKKGHWGAQLARGFCSNTCLWLYGKRPPLLVSKSIFFRGLPKTTNGDGFCTLRMNIGGKSFLLVLSLPFAATLEGTHLCKQMAGKFCGAAQQHLVCEGVLGAAIRDQQLQSTWWVRAVSCLLCCCRAPACGIHSCAVILPSGRGNNFNPEAKEGTIPSESFTAWANKRGLNGKLARCDTSSQSLPYYSLPSSKIWSQFYAKIVIFGTLSL